MPARKKRKATAVETTHAEAAASPPAKRGRVAKTKAADEVIPSPVPPVQTPKRGRPKKTQPVEAVPLPPPADEAVVEPPSSSAKSKKVKPNTSVTRTSKRLSNGASSVAEVASGPRTRRANAAVGGANGVVNEDTSSKAVPVKQVKSKRGAKPKAATKKPADTAAEVIPDSSISTPKKTTKKGAQRKKKADAKTSSSAKDPRTSNVSVNVPSPKDEVSDDDEKADDEAEDDGPNYWLMKAEPESRIEKGKDVKFSIDDLHAAVEPEGWDGVRNPTARNNMRMMLKGDLAFFYHSNCKIPGIVGIMEIVQEHTPDESALDPTHPYHDPKSTAANLKWCKVHVSFRRKFPKLIKLKELQKYAKDGGVLQNMQTLRQSRLSISKVSRKEWDFIMSLVEDDGEAKEEVDQSSRSKVPEARMVAEKKAKVDGGGDVVRPHSNGGPAPAIEGRTGGASATDTNNIADGIAGEHAHQPQDAAERLRELADPLEHFHDNVIESALSIMAPNPFAPV